MQDSTTWVGMDVHKGNIVTVSISGDSGTVMTRWETPNTTKGKERLAGRITGLGKARCVYEFNSLSLISALFSPVCSQPNQMLPVG